MRLSLDRRWLVKLATVALLVPLSLASAQRGSTARAVSRTTADAIVDTLRLYYLGYAIGRETYELGPAASGFALTADFEYNDRGRRTHLAGSMLLRRDYSLQRLQVERLTDSTRTVETRVEIDGGRATVERRGDTTGVEVPPLAFAISPYAPVSQHLALLRYWMAHGRPASLAVVPGGPVNAVHIAVSGRDTVRAGGRRIVLDRYAIDGVVWGIEYLWIDGEGRLAAFTTAGGGGLSLEAIRTELEPAYSQLMRRAAAAAMADLARMSRLVQPVASGLVALVGATLIDGTGNAPVPNATVVVNGGRVVAAGPAASVAVPAGAERIDASGKTIIPGLWDMHT
ncbi:MAG: hypothetical protein ABIZ91_17045, partial [Gemmatimonadaceae bacterium]